jgi:acetate---CoA ligase (ADP-forming) subunit beta
MHDLIRTAVKKGARALSEYDAKRILGAYGIPVTRERLAKDKDSALAAAQAIGYPVVLKACAAELMHKSESGVIEVGITDDNQLRSAYDRIVAATAGSLDGMLVQERVRGQRELVAGLVRDAQFGPCVMVGLGGVLTEVFKDIAFRVAPFDAREASEMLTELGCKEMLDAFRGQAPADRKTLCDTLVAVGRIGLDHKAIGEIDINPIIIDVQGRIKAVDALIVIDPSMR